MRPLLRLAALLPLALAQDISTTPLREYRLSHRLINLSAPESSSVPFAERGVIKVEGESITYAATGIGLDVSGPVKEEHFEWDDIWYQIELSDANGSGRQSRGSIRACHLLSGGSEIFTLSYLGLPQSDPPIGIRLDVTAYDTASQRCPPSAKYAKLNDIARAIESRGSQDIIVEAKSPSIIASPNLRPPPTLDPTSNKPIEPPVEKSFLAKYWVYLLGALLAVSLVMSPEQPEGGGARGRKS